MSFFLLFYNEQIQRQPNFHCEKDRSKSDVLQYECFDGIH